MPPGSPRIWSVVVAGGAGARFGGPKQFALLGGRPVVEWSLDSCRATSHGVVLVVPGDRSGTDLAGGYPGADVVVAGGPSRSASVRCGLAAVPGDADVVVIHDAARPLAARGLFDAVLAALTHGADGAVCAVPVADTLKQVGGEPLVVTGTVERGGLVAVQTPQAFRAAVLRAAHAGGAEATDDAALVEALGATVRVVPGDPRNLKLTTPADLACAQALLGT